MQARKGGAIVLVGSVSGIKAAPGASAYCVSKAGVRMLARTAALEFKKDAVRVNCVSPAGVVTPMWQKNAFLANPRRPTRRRTGGMGCFGRDGSKNAIPSQNGISRRDRLCNHLSLLRRIRSCHRHRIGCRRWLLFL